jgi:hypothetical protein
MAECQNQASFDLHPSERDETMSVSSGQEPNGLPQQESASQGCKVRVVGSDVHSSNSSIKEPEEETKSMTTHDSGPQFGSFKTNPRSLQRKDILKFVICSIGLHSTQEVLRIMHVPEDTLTQYKSHNNDPYQYCMKVLDDRDSRMETVCQDWNSVLHAVSIVLGHNLAKHLEEGILKMEESVLVPQETVGDFHEPSKPSYEQLERENEHLREQVAELEENQSFSHTQQEAMEKKMNEWKSKCERLENELELQALERNVIRGQPTESAKNDPLEQTEKRCELEDEQQSAGCFGSCL